MDHFHTWVIILYSRVNYCTYLVRKSTLLYTVSSYFTHIISGQFPHLGWLYCTPELTTVPIWRDLLCCTLFLVISHISQVDNFHTWVIILYSKVNYCTYLSRKSTLLYTVSSYLTHITSGQFPHLGDYTVLQS